MAGLEKPLECGFESLGPFFATSAPLRPSFLFMTFHQLFLLLIQTIVFPG